METKRIPNTVAGYCPMCGGAGCMYCAGSSRPNEYVSELLDALALGQKYSRDLDEITLQSMRENWSTEQCKTAIDKAMEVRHG